MNCRTTPQLYYRVRQQASQHTIAMLLERGYLQLYPGSQGSHQSPLTGSAVIILVREFWGLYIHICVLHYIATVLSTCQIHKTR